eukprot:408038-Prymnesium_polylepis.1
MPMRRVRMHDCLDRMRFARAINPCTSRQKQTQTHMQMQMQMQHVHAWATCQLAHAHVNGDQ